MSRNVTSHVGFRTLRKEPKRRVYARAQPTIATLLREVVIEEWGNSPQQII